jgi:hypothetical protein
VAAADHSSQRSAVLDAALSWVGTRYHDNACVKGHGVDCAWLLMAPFNEALGLSLTVPRYPWQWYQAPHVKPEGIPYKTEEWYTEGLELNGFVEIPENQVAHADIVASRPLGMRVYCHGGLILDWPDRILHVVFRGRTAGAHVVHALRNAYFRRPLKFFSRKEWHETAESY